MSHRTTNIARGGVDLVSQDWGADRSNLLALHLLVCVVISGERDSEPPRNIRGGLSIAYVPPGLDPDLER